ncbi:MAG: cation-translocating P-type ATPase [Gammaproteobacteria bacterium]|nr:cation-translocating P-type ATPase [Gammaproteobacteria bacterium]
MTLGEGVCVAPRSARKTWTKDVDAAAFDHPRVRTGFLGGRENLELTLGLGGLSCAACAATAERTLREMEQVKRAEVNFARRLAHVELAYPDARIEPILRQLAAAGYEAAPYNPTSVDADLEQERRERLKALGIAALLAMQLMAVAGALYAGERYGMDPRFSTLFKWVGVAFSLALLTLSGREFFVKAYLNLRSGRVGMDVPISVALAVAFAGSLHATTVGSGAVYFDSMGMFVVLLLLARFMEFSTRRRGLERIRALTQSVPLTTLRIRSADGTVESVLAADLVVGDRVLVRVADTVPADGVIVSGATQMSESLLTGESAPVRRGVGERVLAGSLNADQPIEVVVEAVGSSTVVAKIVNDADAASAEKPRITQLADKVAAGFCVGVLVLAVGVAIFWAAIASVPASVWLPIVVSVLIVSCPCALSLATPTVVTVCLNALSERGLYAFRANTVERLADTTHAVFDKTGTLTTDRLALTRLSCSGSYRASDVLSVAAALEAGSNHPIAHFLRAYADGCIAADNTEVHGSGVTGRVQGRQYWFGRRQWVSEATGLALSDDGPSTVLGSAAEGLLAEFEFSSDMRCGAHELIDQLKSLNIAVSMASGDSREAVERVARDLDIVAYSTGDSPGQKLEDIRALQATGARVMMVGDGINDMPGIGGADVSVALGAGSILTQRQADLVLANEDLSTLSAGVRIARNAKTAIKQNLAWAVVYNLMAIPAAAAGYVSPLAAGIGMSLSSMIVVGNAYRLAGAYRAR